MALREEIMTRAHGIARRTAPLVTSLVLAALLLSTIGSVGIAHACANGYCSYHAQGYSATGAFGTGTQVRLPSLALIDGGASDAILFNSFIMDKDDNSLAVETGVDYGRFDLCQGLNLYFFPYATLDDSYYGAAACNTELLQNGTYYYVQAYVTRGEAYSQITNASNNYQDVWFYDWGGYGMSDGWNLTMAEVHVTSGDSDNPSWSGGTNLFHSKWMSSSGSWSYGGYTDTVNDCPYKASYYSPDAWVAYSSC